MDLLKIMHLNHFQSKDIIKSYTKKAEEQGVENPLNDRVLDRLFTISERLYDQKLNQDFIIDEEKYLLKPEASLRVPPLPEQPQPNPQIVQTPMQTGLTPVEQSLLSNEEKVLRLKQRGLA